LDLNPHISF